MTQLFLTALVGISLLTSGVLLADENQQVHLLSLVKVDENESYVLSTIPATDAKDQSITTRTLFSEKGLSYYQVCGVYGGYLIVLKHPYELLAIELTTGVKKRISLTGCDSAMMVSGQLYYVVATERDGKPTHALHRMDLETGIQEKLCMLTSPDPGMQNGHDFTLAVSKDGSKVAATEMIADANQQVQCGIVVVDRRTGDETRSKPIYPSRILLTGAWHYLLAPKLFWLDNETLLVAAADGFNSETLYRYQPATQTSEVICKLPQYGGQMCDPRFSRGNNGEIIIHLGSLGASEVLVPEKKLREHNEAFGDYVLRQVKGQISVYAGDDLLTSGTERARVFVSPDGKQVAWLPAAVRNGMVLQEPMELKVHDRSRGVRTVLTQSFPYLYPTPHNANSTVCLWLNDADLVATKAFDEFSEYSPPKLEKHFDSRPDINKSVDLSLRTDKEIYSQHEPIALSIIVKNLAEAPIKFESRWLNQGTQPFNNLMLLTPSSKSEVLFLERRWADPVGEFITIPPGQSHEFVLTVELGEIGEHRFQMRFEQYSFWKGYLNAEAQFQIIESDDAKELLRNKFDRLVAKSLAEYKSDPSSRVNRDRFVQLGAEGLPLLLEHLQTCEDGSLRRFFGYGLPRIADKTTLPFLSQLLKSNLQFEDDMLVESLWDIYRRGDYESRPVPETTLMLIEAGKHRNVEVRRKAVAALCHSVNEAVDTFMQEAAEDSDVYVAQRAARYVAARQHLPVHRWLFKASMRITPAGLVAARSIIRELEQLSGEEHGKIPDGRFEEFIEDPEKVAQYSTILKAWISYCLTHPRAVETFFDKDLDENTFWQGFAINLYASGTNAPINLNPRVTYTIRD